MNFEQLVASVKQFPIVTDDTRDLVRGGVFVFGGGRERRNEYLEIALEMGARYIVAESPEGVPESMLIPVNDRQVASAQIASAFYDDPSMQLKLLGVTGTCGKTTTTYMLESLLRTAGEVVGVIGTENIRFSTHVRASPNTTPSTFILNRTLREMLDSGCTAVAMEVSSHAIAQKRLYGIAFDAAVFTNLTVEHLDLHGTMENYYATKKLLFTEYSNYALSRGKRPVFSVNLDDDWGARLYRELIEQGTDAMGFGTSLSGNGVNGAEVELNIKGIKGKISVTGQDEADIIEIDSPLIGHFNIENMLGCVATGIQLGLQPQVISSALRNMPGVPGRMERIGSGSGTTIIVDYAHKPGALDVVLATLRPLTRGRLICVFGCGGRRDRAKRPEMGRIAMNRADMVIVTSDNSRGEAFSGILQDILAGIRPQDRSEVQIVENRRRAIQTALNAAQRDDIVVLAGRGAEPYLSVFIGEGKHELVEFDDRQVAASIELKSN
ncbi:UDP-N-acetylmuramoyl-L-alanyl-D-glutamate--2,6-diaminopimelate ligase [Roseibium album]|uniref:UDP-N-acetylmuramoyl-L-alanyl-D-glutamate--2, 6-diaminopimelate ligase n=1 Tax=Roseibium album TaxID=311410 RepID=UPI002492CE09|nr:UDP-N-acetylmuramoyl-L-alanyl-D-glutamate--2,6-diaminopimelate ligase [Roseibium album]